jgi:hypothetical protein
VLFTHEAVCLVSEVPQLTGVILEVGILVQKLVEYEFRLINLSSKDDLVDKAASNSAYSLCYLRLG